MIRTHQGHSHTFSGWKLVKQCKFHTRHCLPSVQALATRDFGSLPPSAIWTVRKHFPQTKKHYCKLKKRRTSFVRRKRASGCVYEIFLQQCPLDFIKPIKALGLVANNCGNSSSPLQRYPIISHLSEANLVSRVSWKIFLRPQKAQHSVTFAPNTR